MPELPEVQALADFLDAHARGRRIERVQILSFVALKSVTPPPSALVGRVIAQCTRRGKFLLLRMVPAEGSEGRSDTRGGMRAGTRAGALGDARAGARGEPGDDARDGASPDGGPAAGRAAEELWLAVHFALAGWLRWHDPVTDGHRPDIRGAEPEGHGADARDAARDGRSAGLRAVPPGAAARSPRPGGPVAMRVELDDGARFDLTEAGTRKRLAVHVVRAPEDVPGIARLGIDPLDPAFDAEAIGRILAGRTGQLKHLLADQALIAGVGNAYSDEALHAARLSPFRPAGNLAPGEVAALHAALLGVLREALARNAGVPPDELKDGKRAAMRVHGRTGLPCPVCGDTVREVAFSERSLQYCPTCQTGGRPLADRRLSRLLR